MRLALVVLCARMDLYTSASARRAAIGAGGCGLYGEIRAKGLSQNADQPVPRLGNIFEHQDLHQAAPPDAAEGNENSRRMPAGLCGLSR